jgi:hypothetical protein
VCISSGPQIPFSHRPIVVGSCRLHWEIFILETMATLTSSHHTYWPRDHAGTNHDASGLPWGKAIVPAIFGRTQDTPEGKTWKRMNRQRRSHSSINTKFDQNVTV